MAAIIYAPVEDVELFMRGYIAPHDAQNTHILQAFSRDSVEGLARGRGAKGDLDRIRKLAVRK